MEGDLARRVERLEDQQTSWLRFATEMLGKQNVGDARMERVESDISTLKSDVSVLKTDVAVLKAGVAVLKTDVAVLKAGVAELSGRGD